MKFSKYCINPPLPLDDEKTIELLEIDFSCHDIPNQGTGAAIEHG